MPSVSVGGQGIGTPPIGPLSPGWEPVHNLIRGTRINLKALPWTAEELYHRPIGVLPNPAPAGLQFRGSAVKPTTVRRGAKPSAPDFGKMWAGAG
jgi:hypothetical protein